MNAGLEYTGDEISTTRCKACGSLSELGMQTHAPWCLPIKTQFSNGEIWHRSALVSRPNWEGRGYRLYLTGDVNGSGCVQVDGEINGRVFRTRKAANAYAERRFGTPAFPWYD